MENDMKKTYFGIDDLKDLKKLQQKTNDLRNTTLNNKDKESIMGGKRKYDYSEDEVKDRNDWMAVRALNKMFPNDERWKYAKRKEADNNRSIPARLRRCADCPYRGRARSRAELGKGRTFNG
jgi:hypothetical protein